jgi:phosphohistidine phosphatase SixA
MLRLLASIVFSVFSLHATTIILVRHAEKAGPTGDVPLTEAGHRRAAVLANVLTDTRLTAVYTSEFRRTQETAAPVLKAKNIEAKIIKAADLDGLVNLLKAAAPSDTILVLTHSDRLPMIAEKLGVKVAPLADTEYSRLVIINTGVVPSSLLSLRYGD